MFAPRRALAFALLAPFALAACTKSPTSKAADALDTASSWAETGAFVAEQWAKGSVPNAFARDAFDETAQSLGSGLATLDASALPLHLRMEIHRLVARDSVIVAGAGRAVDANSIPRAVHDTATLSADAQWLNALSDSLQHARD